MYKIYFIALFFFVGCASGTTEQVSAEVASMATVAIPSQTFDVAQLQFNNKNATWTWKGEIYSGIAESHYPDGSLQSQFGILNGKQGQEAREWFEDGVLKSIANYQKGKLHGEKKTWLNSSPHDLSAELNFHAGKPHGLQKKWYPTGEIFKILQFNMGREEGLQQAFRKNGALFANYEAKNGRNYGLKRASLCFDVKEKEVQYD